MDIRIQSYPFQLPWGLPKHREGIDMRTKLVVVLFRKRKWSIKYFSKKGRNPGIRKYWKLKGSRQIYTVYVKLKNTMLPRREQLRCERKCPKRLCEACQLPAPRIVRRFLGQILLYDEELKTGVHKLYPLSLALCQGEDLISSAFQRVIFLRHLG